MTNDYHELARRLQQSLLERFDYDKRAVLRYIQPKLGYFARKADSYRGTKFHVGWSRVYKAYSQVEFALGYYLSLDEECEAEMAQTIRSITDE